MFFFVVRVFGSIARDTGRHFFHGVGGGGYDGAVFLFDAHEADVHYFVGGVVTEDQLAELLYSGITLHADADGEVASAGAVVFKTRGGVELLDDERFLGEIGGCRFLRRTLWR